MRSHSTLAVIVASLVAGAGCAGSADSAVKASPASVPVSAPASADAALDAFFAEVFQRRVDRSPQFQTMLGIKKDYGRWDDLSDERQREDHALAQQDLERLRAFPVESLSPAARVSREVFEYTRERSIEAFPWRFHSYPVNQMYGIHSTVPAFLINYHRIESVSDAEAYVSRLRRIPELFAQVRDGLAAREAKGISPPRFVFPHVIGSCENLLRGRPFEPEATSDSTLLADFRKKVAAFEAADRERLIAEATTALEASVAPAYRELIGALRGLEARATTDDGAWKFPEGLTFYGKALRWTTSTDLTAEQIHALGLAEVERIHGEMREIMKTVGFKGELSAFFEFMRKDPQFYFTNDEAGRSAYLEQATLIIETMKGRLPELFSRLPKADVVVKRVEAFREKAAGKAFYNRPALDGSTPGYYYANLYDMADMPKYQMEALAYHEGIPGHHMQLAIAQELEDLPSFRKFSRFTAYIEGWGLYSELVPKEMGFYRDPYSDFGRLAMELWRACRLVVDTGIHAMKWSREKAIDYLTVNTPNPKGDAIKAIERYIVMPSQATAYKVGMLEILKLRAEARAALGEAFDLRGFHDVVLGHGPVPLSVLGALVRGWVVETKAAAAARP